MNQLTIILVEPQLGWNIGSACRAMLNFGLMDLRIVKPRDGWPNPDAEATAAGADKVLNNVQVFESVTEAMADLNVVFATSARSHDMVKPFYSPRDGVGQLYSEHQKGSRVGILFGGESSGLTSEDVSLCNGIITIPTNPEFSSMNLAHSVVIMAYEWQAHQGTADTILPVEENEVEYASREDMNLFFEHLERELDEVGFLTPVEKRPRMVKNIRSIFNRINPTAQEVRTLRGIVRYLRKDRS